MQIPFQVFLCSLFPFLLWMSSHLSSWVMRKYLKSHKRNATFCASRRQSRANEKERNAKNENEKSHNNNNQSNRFGLFGHKSRPFLSLAVASIADVERWKQTDTTIPIFKLSIFIFRVNSHICRFVGIIYRDKHAFAKHSPNWKWVLIWNFVLIFGFCFVEIHFRYISQTENGQKYDAIGNFVLRLLPDTPKPISFGVRWATDDRRFCTFHKNIEICLNRLFPFFSFDFVVFFFMVAIDTINGIPRREWWEKEEWRSEQIRSWKRVKMNFESERFNCKFIFIRCAFEVLVCVCVCLNVTKPTHHRH